ncbi:hypothetical protein SAY87_031023 [Trapa incisa]|uniref:NAB domain-containing protein n=1 Tax=Trapa incisa TaxID=236973 RepID=A0AAN7QKX2_9MYRT|nr:hypothetical protein SAY87_031023 [Trapa incisa]
MMIDMEEKVGETLKLIDDDGDSFVKRANTYYRKRPEILAFVEDSFKSYRALADRYDHLSRELQSANRKIATAFPDELHSDVNDDDEEDDISRKSGNFPDRQGNKDLPEGQKGRIPKAPGGPGKDFRSPSMSFLRKGQLRRNTSYGKAVINNIPSSGLSKDEALQEIDKLQKEILSLQTEKEFVKSSFERGKERYWEIENQITEMQKKVCSLQDEFSVGIVIEDNEARTLMATSALKSCQEALIKLQERHRQSEEEVKIEDGKIQEAYEKFQGISGVSVARNVDQEERTDGMNSAGGDHQASELRDKGELELARDEMMEEINAKVSVPELAERIDHLVDKVVNLEVEVSLQASLVRRLRLETAVLQAHVQALEEEKKNVPPDGSEKMHEKMEDFEKELKRVKNFKQHVVSQCRNLLSHFTLATSKISSLSAKLEHLNLDDEVEMAGLFREAKSESTDGRRDEEEMKVDRRGVQDHDAENSREERKDGRVPTFHDPAKDRQGEIIAISGPSSDVDASSEKPPESVQNYKGDNHDLFDTVTETTNQEFGEEGGDGQPNWRKLYLNGFEDRDKSLLDEYTSILRSYKDVKNKLSEVEKKNREGLFEMAMEIRDLRNENAQMEEELQSLRQKLGGPTGNTGGGDENSNGTALNNDPNVQSSPSSATTESGSKQPLYKLLLLHNDRFTKTMKFRDKDVNLYKIGRPSVVTTMEEKLRMDIDEIMEENLEFWLRFSTSVHQIQKFQTTFLDLQAELVKLHEGSSKSSRSSSSAPPSTSEVRPIYKHLKEIQTEIKLWFEHYEMLKEELQDRYSALGDIQDEITRVLEMGGSVGGEKDLITEYQGAKYQGEVQNMKQENKKVEDELRAGLERVKKLQGEIERVTKKLDKDHGITALMKEQRQHARSSSSIKSKIPLRSFLFGAKLKKQKSPSLLSCVSPAMQSDYTSL